MTSESIPPAKLRYDNYCLTGRKETIVSKSAQHIQKNSVKLASGLSTGLDGMLFLLP
jgi:hypothetical protein